MKNLYYSFKNHKKEILIPDNVEIQKIPYKITSLQTNLLISGPLGETVVNLEKLDPTGAICFSLEKKANLALNAKNIKSLILSSRFKEKSFFKSICNIILNKITGVSSGFLITIRIVGVGYRAEIENSASMPFCSSKKSKQVLIFKVGFSHDLKYMIPSSIRVFLLEPTLICLYGIDKNQVTQIVAKIKQIKPPSVYKGKGIKLINEIVFLKQGKRK